MPAYLKKRKKVRQSTSSPTWGDATPHATSMKLGTLCDLVNLLTLSSFQVLASIGSGGSRLARGRKLPFPILQQCCSCITQSFALQHLHVTTNNQGKSIFNCGRRGWDWDTCRRKWYVPAAALDDNEYLSAKHLFPASEICQRIFPVWPVRQDMYCYNSSNVFVERL